MAEQEQNTQAEQDVTTPEGLSVNIQTLYTKDISFEAPNSPEIFLTEYKPEIGVNLTTKSKDLENDAYESELKVTVTSKVGEKTAYIAEVTYAGVFVIKGAEDEIKARLLRTFCQEQIFPYVREAISETVARGGFPRFVLQPINFNAMYEEGMKQAAAQQPEANA